MEKPQGTKEAVVMIFLDTFPSQVCKKAAVEHLRQILGARARLQRLNQGELQKSTAVDLKGSLVRGTKIVLF